MFCYASRNLPDRIGAPLLDVRTWPDASNAGTETAVVRVPAVPSKAVDEGRLSCRPAVLVFLASSRRTLVTKWRIHTPPNKLASKHAYACGQTKWIERDLRIAKSTALISGRGAR